VERAASVFRKKGDIGLPMMTNLFAATNFIPVLAPYVIFPISIDHRIDLMAGNYLVISLMNISGLARWLEKKGWRTHIIFNAKNPKRDPVLEDFPALRVWRQGDGVPFIKGVDVPLDLLQLAALEFWMPESIEESIKAIWRQNEHEIDGYHNVNFQNSGKYAFD
jgi:hypothetical protein